MNIFSQQKIALENMDKRSLAFYLTEKPRHYDEQIQSFIAQIVIHLLFLFEETDITEISEKNVIVSLVKPSPYIRINTKNLREKNNNIDEDKRENSLIFSLGNTLKYIRDNAGSKDVLLTDIIKQLTATNNSRSFSLADVVEHPYFGNTLDDRKIFFNEIKEMYFINPPTYRFQRLLDKLDMLHHQYDFIQKFNDLSSIISYRKNLRELIDIAEQTMQNLREPKKKNYINTIKISAEKKLTESHQLSCQSISSAELNIVLQQASQKYIKTNRLDSQNWNFSGFFHFHGQTGKTRALQFAKKINTLFQKGATPLELYSEIYNHLDVGPGSWASQSFKQFIVQQLATVSHRPFDKWFDYLQQQHPKKSALTT